VNSGVLQFRLLISLFCGASPRRTPEEAVPTFALAMPTFAGGGARANKSRRFRGLKRVRTVG